MKTYGILFKNIAALFMMVALISLLLPFLKITTPDKTASVSGIELLKIGAGTGLEYYSNGEIEDDYVIKGSVTWGDLKDGVNYAIENDNLRQAEETVVFSMLPVLFCFLAMILTFLAIGKKTMILPTLLIAAAVLENIFLISGFKGIQNKILNGLGSAGIQFTLLIGVYTFTILCGIAFLILLFLWITGGFNKAENDNSSSDDDDSKKDKKKRGLKRDRRGKRRGRKKKTKRKKKKSSKDGKEKGDKNSNREQSEDKEADSVEVPEASGDMQGVSGMYEGMELNLTELQDGDVTIGTTKDTVSLHGTEIPEGKKCTIHYDSVNKQYRITSHSNTNIVLQPQDGEPCLLVNGKSHSVGGNVMILVGDSKNTIKLN